MDPIDRIREILNTYQKYGWKMERVLMRPYALFETFEADESEEDREQVRREMEARMREYVNREPGEVMSDDNR